MYYSTLETFEEYQSQSQGQSQSQPQDLEGGAQEQEQRQEQRQQQQRETEGESKQPSASELTIPMSVSKFIVFLMVSVFLTLTIMMESKEKNPIQKLMDALRNPQSLLLIILVGVLYASVRVMKLIGKFSDEEYETFMTVERHSNVAFILVLFEAIGMQFTSYWIIWIATFLHV